MYEQKVTIPYLQKMMREGEQICMLTGYDFPLAMLEEKAGVEIILVGDSLGMTVMGLEGTLPVTLDTMVNHCAAARRGAPKAFIVGDMPYMTYQISKEEAIRNAGKLMALGNVDCVKLEGGQNMAETIRAIVNATVPVMGHIGLTPQSTSMMGGFKAQGAEAKDALEIIKDAAALEDAGISLLLLEAIPPEVAKIIAERSNVPVIALGAGSDCHGQCLIAHDMLGFFERFTPRFVKKYANLNKVILEGLRQYREEVKSKAFPEKKHSYGMKKGELEKLQEMLRE